MYSTYILNTFNPASGSSQLYVHFRADFTAVRINVLYTDSYSHKIGPEVCEP